MIFSRRRHGFLSLLGARNPVALWALPALLLFTPDANTAPAPASPGRLWNPAAAAKYSSRTGGTVLVISRNGKLAFQWLGRGVTSATPLPVFSITKSIVALTCLANSRADLDTRIPGHPKTSPTIRELLSQTSGVSPGYRELYGRSVPDVRRAAAALPREAEAGQRFVYGPSHYELLGTIPGLFGSGQSQPTTRLLSRLGIRPAAWHTDQHGNIFLSAGAALTATDLLRLGEFVLSGGRGPGIFPIIPRGKFHEAIRGTRANACYGLGFWLNAGAAPGARERDIEEAISAGLNRADWRASCLSRNAPSDLICMAGSGGQRVYIIPSQKTVVVRMGRPNGFRDPDFLRALFNKG